MQCISIKGFMKRDALMLRKNGIFGERFRLGFSPFLSYPFLYSFPPSLPQLFALFLSPNFSPFIFLPFSLSLSPPPFLSSSLSPHFSLFLYLLLQLSLPPLPLPISLHLLVVSSELRLFKMVMEAQMFTLIPLFICKQ